MAKKQVIAYFMHENEQAAAQRLLSESESTESFVYGSIDENEIDRLRNEGLVVQELDLEETPRVEQLIVAKTGAPFKQAAEFKLPEFDATQANYYVVRLHGPLLESWRDKIETKGVKISEALAPNTYSVKLTSDQAQELSRLPYVASVRKPEARDLEPIATRSARIPPQHTRPDETRMLTLDVRLRDESEMPGVERWIENRSIVVAGKSRRKVRIYVPDGSPEIDALRALPAVERIDPFVPPKLTNDRARALIGLDAGNPAPVLTQTGKGQVVAVADTGLDDTHGDFNGRIVGLDDLGRPGDPSDPNGHGTHVAGTVLGDGSNSGGQFKGIAPEAELYFQSILDHRGELGGLPVDLNDLFDAPYQAGARIHNNSWGAATESRYTVNSIEVDEFVAAHRDMLIVISAGNEGVGAMTPNAPGNAQRGFVDWLSIGSPASAKNALTVGASRSDRTAGGLSGLTWNQVWPNDYPDVPIADENISGDEESMAAFSSRGPCDDRRIKPDLVAPGTDIGSAKSGKAPLRNFWGPISGHGGKYAYMGGTSMSAPVVAGAAALIRQHFVDNGHQPSAALLKATLINGCRWLSGQDSTADFADAPNFHQGFGALDLPRTIPNAGQPDLALEFRDDWNPPLNTFNRTGQRFRFRVGVGGQRELRICLAWTDLPARALQNNLNLLVESLATNDKWIGNTDLPQSLNIPDPDNNVEIVRISRPPAGDFLIQISASNLLNNAGQDFALVVTGDLTSGLVDF